MIIDHLCLYPVLFSLKSSGYLLDEVIKGRLLVEYKRRFDKCQRFIVDRNGVLVGQDDGVYETRAVGIFLKCSGKLPLMIDGLGWRLSRLSEWLIDGLE